MKNLNALFAAFFLLLSSFASGQEAVSPLVFDSMSFDFGTVNEADGTLFHTFSFINGASVPVRISQISTSCNCVSVSYPQSVLKGGEVGTISVAFNPIGLAGKIMRQVEIFLSDGYPGVTLEIATDIVPSEYDISQEYKIALPDGLRMEGLSCKFGYIPVGQSSERHLAVINDSDAPLSFDAEPLDPGSHLVASCPESLGPHEAGAIILRYNLATSGYDSYKDDVQISVNGAPCNRIVSVTAVGVDDFSKNKSAAPSMQIYPSVLQVRKLPLLEKYTTSFVIANNGKSDLVIRKVVAPEGVEADLEDGTAIKPGTKKKVSVKSSIADFSVEVIANDPVRPYKELRSSISK